MPVDNNLENAVENVQETVTKNANRIDLKGLFVVGGSAIIATTLIVLAGRGIKKLKDKKSAAKDGESAEVNPENVISEAQA